MAESNVLSSGGYLMGMALAGPESFSPQQLAYLKQALGLDETVLWEAPTASGVSMAVGTEFNLSESIANFEKVIIVSGRLERGKETVFYPGYDSANVNSVVVENVNANGSNVNTDYVALTITSNTKLTSALVTRKTLGSSSISTASPTPLFMYKIVGVNRIANN